MKRKTKAKIRTLILVSLLIMTGMLGGSGLEALIRLSEKALEIYTQIELASETMVEEIDGGEIPLILEEMSETDREIFGQGLFIDMASPETVANSLMGECIYLNNPYGSQCVNTTNLITEQMVGHYMSTCGTGAARGIWDCRDKNSEGGLELIYNINDVREGDILVFNGGTWGHTGMAMSGVYNGYIRLFSTNQGGPKCEKGGAAANIININTKTFLGAFRWHGWDYLFEEPEPEEVPVVPDTPDTGIVWHNTQD